MDFDELLDEFIESMYWSTASTERERNLVLANLRGFVIFLDEKAKKGKIKCL